MKIITISYALACHDDGEVSTLDGVREIATKALLDGGVEIVHNVSGTERHVDVPDPIDDPDDIGQDRYDAWDVWQQKAFEQPEFQDVPR